MENCCCMGLCSSQKIIKSFEQLLLCVCISIYSFGKIEESKTIWNKLTHDILKKSQSHLILSVLLKKLCFKGETFLCHFFLALAFFLCDYTLLHLLCSHVKRLPADLIVIVTTPKKKKLFNVLCYYYFLSVKVHLLCIWLSC